MFSFAVNGSQSLTVSVYKN